MSTRRSLAVGLCVCIEALVLAGCGGVIDSGGASDDELRGSGSKVRCGDKVCASSETCSTCAVDCGACPPPVICGDNVCSSSESCSTCAADCGACAPPPSACGNGTCDAGEDVYGCPADCSQCGDHTCTGPESAANCPVDCGAFLAVCGDGVCNGPETCTSCPADCGTSCAPLPSAYFITMPTPRKQVSGECVAFSTVVGARSAMAYYQSGATRYDDAVNVFSPSYVFNQVKFGDCGSGTSIGNAVDVMTRQGVCTWQSMPYIGDDTTPTQCDAQPTAAQQTEAARYKIHGYSAIRSDDRLALKALIRANRPVIISFLACDELINQKAGEIWHSCSTGSLPHAVVLSGYDDARNAFQIFNSFGTSWSDGGFGWVDYDFYASRAAYYAYVLEP